MNSWEQASFTAVEIHNNIENKVFFVPPYQRGCVWSSKQKDQFVDTLKRGLPYSREITLYIVHGFLHMAGEDDLTPEAKRKMRRAEKRVLSVLEQKINFERVFGQGLIPVR